MHYKVPLVLASQPEGGYVVTSPLLPELITEGDTIEEAMANVQDALRAVIELYGDLNRMLPKEVMIGGGVETVQFEALVAAA